MGGFWQRLLQEIVRGSSIVHKHLHTRTIVSSSGALLIRPEFWSGLWNSDARNTDGYGRKSARNLPDNPINFWSQSFPNFCPNKIFEIWAWIQRLRRRNSMLPYTVFLSSSAAFSAETVCSMMKMTRRYYCPSQRSVGIRSEHQRENKKLEIRNKKNLNRRHNDLSN